LSAVERGRFRGVGVWIDRPPPPAPRTGALRRMLSRFGDSSTWRQFGYWAILVVLGPVNFAVVVALAAGAVALVLLPTYVAAVNGGVDLWLVTIDSVWAAVPVAVVALAAGAVVLPVVVVGLTLLDAALASRLLGPGRQRELTERVEQLTESRTRVVDAAEQERRRMERDLHDGAQQQLVAMSMTVGRLGSRLKRSGGDAESLALVEQAQAEIQTAISDIRDLTRGLHPPVLTDRGLDAALSAVAARCPVPVTLEVDVPERPSLTVESIAYFVVSEALTNVAKHAVASQAAVRIERRGDLLYIGVWDDGRGGAAATPGSGLAGLADRVAGVDGRFRVSSPAGGPTLLEVELPCGS
jgi:signal transduction histidine kinase